MKGLIVLIKVVKIMYRKTESQFHNLVENNQVQFNHAISIEGSKQSILMEMQECLKRETNALQNQILFKSTHNYPYKHRLHFMSF